MTYSIQFQSCQFPCPSVPHISAVSWSFAYKLTYIAWLGVLRSLIRITDYKLTKQLLCITHTHCHVIAMSKAVPLQLGLVDRNSRVGPLYSLKLVGLYVSPTLHWNECTSHPCFYKHWFWHGLDAGTVTQLSLLLGNTVFTIVMPCP